MKKIIVIISAILAIAALVFAAVLISGAEDITIIASGKCGANVNWTFDSANVLKITGSGTMSSYSILDSSYAPWYPYCRKIQTVVISNGITSIGDYAFYSCNSLTNVDVPNSVTSIGEYAFNSSGVKNVSLSTRLTSIGESAFNSCHRLTSIDIPNGVTSIRKYTFWGCSNLTSINISDNVTSIGDCAFFSCKKLTNIDIPDSVTSIGDLAFSHCSSLTSINIPAAVTSISERTFSNCNSLISINVNENNKNYSDDNSILFNKNKTTLIIYPCGIIGEYIIPSGVTSIGNNAFSGCSNLTNIDIPDSVTSIGNNAFSGCTSLTSIYFHGDAQSVGSWPFDGVVATAYYPEGNPTWTTDVMQNYKGTITWIAYEYPQNECEKNGHKYKSEVTAPTYTEQGYTTHTCSVCGDSYIDSYTDVLEPIRGDLNYDGVVNVDDVLICLDLCFEN